MGLREANKGGNEIGLTPTGSWYHLLLEGVSTESATGTQRGLWLSEEAASEMQLPASPAQRQWTKEWGLQGFSPSPSSDSTGRTQMELRGRGAQMQSLNVVFSDRAGCGRQRETNRKHPAQKPPSFFLLDSALWFGVYFSDVLDKIRVIFLPVWRRKPFLSAKLKTTRLTGVQLSPGNTWPHLQPKWKESSVMRFPGHFY